ncbi:MAG: alpha/beta hydrolase [Pseudomonadota bacterium]
MTWTIQPRSERAGLATLEAGPEGAPLVLALHGVGLRAEAWGAQIAGLAGRTRIVAPDMPGHGESAVAPGCTTIADYTDRAEAVLMALGAPALVMGHSMGAMIALELAARQPERVRGVVALNAVFERDAAATAAVMARADALGGVARSDPTPTLTRWFGEAGSSERDACAAWLSGVDPAGYRAAYRAFASSRIPDRAGLSRLACPAMFMTGADEPNSTPAMSQAMAALAPLGRAEIVKGAAHMLPMTHPEPVNAALLGRASGRPGGGRMTQRISDRKGA